MIPSGNKIIRDVVHGYIPLRPLDIEIIDTPNFQRLRHIKQTGAHSVYPNANHTRFEHSLGVMHLGNRVMANLDLDNLTQFENTLRYACLLHDVGHAPFSHLGESFYDSTKLILKIQNLLEKYNINSAFRGDKAAPHELCSCAIALDKFGTILLDNNVDLDLMCRMILGEKYGDANKKSEDSLIGILNSTADVDKLDYILRDSFMSGAQLITIDTDRLVSAYQIYDNSLTFSSKAISTIGNLIWGRNALYMWVYNHHITVYTDTIFKRLLIHLLEEDTNAKDSFFSYSAVAEALVDDHDVISYVRSKKELDPYSSNLYNQLFSRNYYKPLWKTVFDFEAKIPDQSKQDEFIKIVGEYRKQQKGLESLEIRIVQATGKDLKLGDFYIAMAEFKPFVPMAGKSLYIYLNGQRKRFEDIFQSNIFSKPYPELPHVFVKDSQTQETLLKVLNDTY